MNADLKIALKLVDESNARLTSGTHHEDMVEIASVQNAAEVCQRLRKKLQKRKAMTQVSVKRKSDYHPS